MRCVTNLKYTWAGAENYNISFQILIKTLIKNISYKILKGGDVNKVKNKTNLNKIIKNKILV